MKSLAFGFALTLTLSCASAATILAGQAASHIGETATVEGLATEVKVSRGGTTFVDIDGTYPSQTFTAVVFASDTAAVGDLSSLQGKTVDVTGTIRLYRGKPEIIVKSRSQIVAR
jgi:DNA/RNA endonuclease YhcR with UshA esterase domain